jgi:hypothetical protein
MAELPQLSHLERDTGSYYVPFSTDCDLTTEYASGGPGALFQVTAS